MNVFPVSVQKDSGLLCCFMIHIFFIVASFLWVWAERGCTYIWWYICRSAYFWRHMAACLSVGEVRCTAPPLLTSISVSVGENATEELRVMGHPTPFPTEMAFGSGILRLLVAVSIINPWRGCGKPSTATGVPGLTWISSLSNVSSCSVVVTYSYGSQVSFCTRRDRVCGCLTLCLLLTCWLAWLSLGPLVSVRAPCLTGLWFPSDQAASLLKKGRGIHLHISTIVLWNAIEEILIL